MVIRRPQLNLGVMQQPDSVGIAESQVRPAISNRNPKEQPLIHRWWHDVHGSGGRLVWAYYL